MSVSLTRKRKELMLEVINGNPFVVPIMHQLIHYKDCNKFLKWLIKNQIVGYNLLDWIKVEHQSSVLGMVQTIVKYNNKNREIRPMLLGKDWVK